MTHGAHYFQHDYNARNDERLLMLRAEFGAEAYGVFWMILETMAEASTGQINRVAIGGLSLGYGVAKDRLESIIDFCVRVELFKEANGAIYSPRMQSHLDFRKVLKEAGSAGARKRWSTSQKNSQANAKGKERKEKNSKERTSVDHKTQSLYDFIDSECQQCGIANSVNITALDIQVRRYQDMQLRVETRKCLTWLVEHGKRDITAMRLANWFSKAAEIQKREGNRQLERFQASKDPALASQLKARGDKPETPPKGFSIAPELKAKLLSRPNDGA